MASSYVTYTGTGAQTNWSVPFLYLNKEHVHVYVNGTEKTTGISWPSAGTITISPAVASGARLKIARQTPDTPLVDFENGNVLTEANLSTATLQAIYRATEAVDRANDSVVLGNADAWDFQNKRGINAADPVDNQDVVTKNWAETAMSSELAQAIAAANQAIAAALTFPQVPNPLYIACGGQSNAIGRGGISSPVWITDSRVKVWTGTAWASVKDMQGQAPFDTDTGSNSPFIWAAQDIARRHGVEVRLVYSAHGSTGIEKWVGTDADRTISGNPYVSPITGNRPMWVLWQDQIEDASIPFFHGLFWHQGEANFDSNDDTHVAQLEYLKSQVEDLGTTGRSNQSSRLFMALGGLYTGPLSGQQANREASLERFARENADSVAFVNTMDLIGRPVDLDDPPATVINHFRNDEYTRMGWRFGEAFLGLYTGHSTISDIRLEKLIIPPSDETGAVVGHRSYERATITDATLTLSKDDGVMRGETYRFSGTSILNLDGNLNAGLGDGGMGFEFYMLSNSDQVTVNGNGRNVSIMNGAAAASSQVLTGQACRVRVVYQSSQYQLQVFPLNAHSQSVIEAGSSTARQQYSPLELRQAANAAIVAKRTFQTVNSDSSSSVTIGNGGVVVDNTTLTANRTRTLGTTGAVTGDMFFVKRKGNNATFTYTLRDGGTGTPTLKTLAVGDWAQCIFDGTNWQLIAYGSGV